MFIMPTENSPTPPVQKKSKTGLWIVGCLVAIILVICCACASVIGLGIFAPTALLMQFVSNEPITTNLDKWNESQILALQEKVGVGLMSDSSLTLSPEEVTQLFMMGSADEGIVGFEFDVTSDDKAQLLLSLEIPSEESGGKTQYLNIDLEGDVEINNGKFTKLVIDKLKLGKFNVGTFLKGQDLATNAQSSMEEEGTNPIEGIDYLAIKNGMVEIKVNEKFGQQNTNQLDFDSDYNYDYDYDTDYDFNYDF
jgi:hypothetical protein